MSTPALHLPDVTLLAVDTRSPALALRALAHSARHIHFGRSLLLTHEIEAGLAGTAATAGIACADIGPIRSSADYSRFVLGGLLPFVDTRHVLIVQWDGYVADPACWDPAFLDTDYLGAPWGKARGGHFVGNGGFSLRSRRLLLALQDERLRAQWHHPEDICIAQTLRSVLEAGHGMRFGSLPLAQRFAYENEAPPGPTFGFHGFPNLHRVTGAAGFAEVLALLPDSVITSRDGFKTARALLRAGQPDLALQMLERRLAGGAADWRTRWMAWQARRRAGR